MCTYVYINVFFPDHVNFHVLHLYMSLGTCTGTDTCRYISTCSGTCTDVHVSVHVTNVHVQVQNMKIYMIRKKNRELGLGNEKVSI
jgi:hypothetical protein